MQTIFGLPSCAQQQEPRLIAAYKAKWPPLFVGAVSLTALLDVKPWGHTIFSLQTQGHLLFMANAVYDLCMMQRRFLWTARWKGLWMCSCIYF